jgi:hypothetical protein
LQLKRLEGTVRVAQKQCETIASDPAVKGRGDDPFNSQIPSLIERAEKRFKAALELKVRARLWFLRFFYLENSMWTKKKILFFSAYYWGMFVRHDLRSQIANYVFYSSLFHLLLSWHFDWCLTLDLDLDLQAEADSVFLETVDFFGGKPKASHEFFSIWDTFLRQVEANIPKEAIAAVQRAAAETKRFAFFFVLFVALFTMASTLWWFCFSFQFTASQSALERRLVRVKVKEMQWMQWLINSNAEKDFNVAVHLAVLVVSVDFLS